VRLSDPCAPASDLLPLQPEEPQNPIHVSPPEQPLHHEPSLPCPDLPQEGVPQQPSPLGRFSSAPRPLLHTVSREILRRNTSRTGDRHPLRLGDSEQFLLTADCHAIEHPFTELKNGVGLEFAVRLFQNRSPVPRVKISCSCPISFLMQIHSKGVEPVRCDATSTWDPDQDKFVVENLFVTVGSQVKTLHLSLYSTNTDTLQRDTVAVTILVESAPFPTRPLRSSLRSSHRRAHSQDLSRQVSFNNDPEVFKVSVLHPTPPNPRKIQRTNESKQQKRDVLLTAEQEALVRKKIRSLTRQMYLSYGDILMLAVGKFNKSYPPHVEEFFEWLSCQKWKDDQGRTVKTFSLLSDRTWLKPIISSMFSVHIQYGAGELSL